MSYGGLASVEVALTHGSKRDGDRDFLPPLTELSTAHRIGNKGEHNRDLLEPEDRTNVVACVGH